MRVPASAAVSSNFYPRPPRGGRPFDFMNSRAMSEFLPTPSARRATWSPYSQRRRVQVISTHALREEGDCLQSWRRRRYNDFYPRPPRGGRPESGWAAAWSTDFYPRPPRGGRHVQFVHLDGLELISTHALREEGDVNVSYIEISDRVFLPTPSARRATKGI